MRLMAPRTALLASTGATHPPAASTGRSGNEFDSQHLHFISREVSRRLLSHKRHVGTDPTRGSGPLKMLLYVPHVRSNVRSSRRMLDLFARAYTTVSVDDVAACIGLPPDQAVQCAPAGAENGPDVRPHGPRSPPLITLRLPYSPCPSRASLVPPLRQAPARLSCSCPPRAFPTLPLPLSLPVVLSLGWELDAQSGLLTPRAPAAAARGMPTVEHLHKMVECAPLCMILSDV